MAKTIKSAVTKKKTTTELPMYLQPKIKEPIKYMKKSFKKNKKEYWSNRKCSNQWPISFSTHSTTATIT